MSNAKPKILKDPERQYFEILEFGSHLLFEI